MNEIMTLKEKILHGNERYPYSFHESIIESGQEMILYPHWHHECEFLYVLKGCALFKINNTTFTLHKGECLYIPPTELHMATSIDSNPCHFFAFVFSPLSLTNFSENAIYLHFIEPVFAGKIKFMNHFISKYSWQKDFLSYIRKLYTIRNDSIIDSELLVKSYLYALWHIMFTHPLACHSRKKEIESRIQPVLDFIHLHYNETISLQELASKVPLSISQLNRLFKKETGLSPFSYLIRFRIYKSCYFLTQSNENVANIALISGFSSINNYNKFFQLIIGCTPTEYRRNSEKYMTFL
jgi:AraC-like DNA-binding protein/quercetin dioxygenase-like cupin family protein